MSLYTSKSILDDFYKSSTRHNKNGNICVKCDNTIPDGDVCMRAIIGYEPRTQFTIYEIMHTKCFRIALVEGMAEIKREKKIATNVKKKRFAELNIATERLKKMLMMRYHPTLGGRF